LYYVEIRFKSPEEILNLKLFNQEQEESFEVFIFEYFGL